MGAYTSAVQQLYVAYFSRPADAAGLSYWESVVTAAKGDTSAVSAAFAASKEYTDTFAGQTEYQVVDTIFKNLFGRGAEPAALTFWGQALINKTITVSNAVTAIAAGAQGTDKDTYAAKVTAATAFSAALYDSSAEMTGYAGTAANAAAKAWLSGVNKDTLAANTTPTAIDAAVTNVVATADAAAGQSFTLTSGVDEFTGTSHADSFKAPVQNAAGTAINSLNSSDVIDGGAGVDSLQLVATAGQNNVLTGTVKNIEKITIVGSDNISFSQTAAQVTAVNNAQAAVTAAQAAYDDAVAKDALLATATATKTAADAALTTANTDKAGAQAVQAAVAAVVAANPADNAADLAAAVTAASGVSVPGTAADAAVANAVIAAAGAPNATLATVKAAALVAYNTYADAAAAALTTQADAITALAAATTAAAADATALLATLNTAKATLASAQAAAGGSTVDASFFKGSTDISIDGKATTLTNLGTQNVTLNASANVADTLSYASGKTTANVALVSVGGSLTVAGADLETVNLSGSVKSGSTLAVNGNVTNVNLALTAKGAVTLNSNALESIVSTGSSALTLTANGSSNTLSKVTTGAGADTVNVSTKSVKDVAATTDINETVDVTVAVGDGNDIVSINAYGAGKTNIDLGAGNDKLTLNLEAPGSRALGAVNVTAGAGDDKVTLSNGLLATLTKLTADGADTTSDVKISGGDGRDTLAFSDTTITAATYERLAANVTGFEKAEFTGANITADASKLSQFDTLIVDNGAAALTKIAATQTLVASGTVTATAAGFVAGTMDDAGTPAVNETVQPTYAGTLNVETVAGNGSNLTGSAESIKATVNADVDATTGEALSSWLDVNHGVFKNIDVTLESARGVDDYAGQERTSGFEIWGAVSGVESVKVAGAGYVYIDTVGVVDVNGTASTTLKTIDLSGMVEFLDLDDKGQPTVGHGDYGYNNLSTSEVYANDAVAETIKLGGAHDYVYTTSKGAKMDTITGFKLVAGATAGVADYDKSDMLDVGAYNFAKLAIDAGNNTLTLALDQAAKNGADRVVFVSGGDTYVYIDTDGADGAATSYSAATDLLVKLTGVYDLDLLVNLLNHGGNL